MTAAISVTDLAKRYGDVRAVDGVSFEVREGEFFGLLGPNGAGKTTTLEMVEGLRRPDGGRAVLLGEPSWPRNQALLRRIGVQLQASAFFEKLTAREQIRTFASLYGVSDERADAMLAEVGLTEKAGTREDKLSGGRRAASAGSSGPSWTRPASRRPGSRPYTLTCGQVEDESLQAGRVVAGTPPPACGPTTSVLGRAG
ncbi:ABC transporter ATP-binding protein [Streptomyces sp. B5E4]|uniref:ABC transporter ATP-binding protein n=1 Tax=Streptomyces sp. B5E4 TaxID=3153568 RepID=UPI00325C4C9B